MKFYSEILNQLFDTQEELLKSEAAANDELTRRKAEQKRIRETHKILQRRVADTRAASMKALVKQQKAETEFRAAERTLAQFEKENCWALADYDSVFDMVNEFEARAHYKIKIN